MVGDLRDRARRRQRRRVGEVPRRARDRGGSDGWVINGPKAWCTFAGRANVLALLARTDPDLGEGREGPLALHRAEGRLRRPRLRDEAARRRRTGRQGRRDAGLPRHALVHARTSRATSCPPRTSSAARRGSAAASTSRWRASRPGRLQTGGRACGVAQAALEKTAEYVVDRAQFGRPIGEYQLTQFTSAAWRRSSRPRARSPTPPRARWTKTSARPRRSRRRRSSSPATSPSRSPSSGQLLHGGWGYAEEYPISRYVVDAQVLPIFEGVKPILELKVVGAQPAVGIASGHRRRVERRTNTDAADGAGYRLSRISRRSGS